MDQKDVATKTICHRRLRHVRFDLLAEHVCAYLLNRADGDGSQAHLPQRAPVRTMCVHVLGRAVGRRADPPQKVSMKACVCTCSTEPMDIERICPKGRRRARAWPPPRPSRWTPSPSAPEPEELDEYVRAHLLGAEWMDIKIDLPQRPSVTTACASTARPSRWTPNPCAPQRQDLDKHVRADLLDRAGGHHTHLIARAGGHEAHQGLDQLDRSGGHQAHLPRQTSVRMFVPLCLIEQVDTEPICSDRTSVSACVPLARSSR